MRTQEMDTAAQRATNDSCTRRSRVDLGGFTAARHPFQSAIGQSIAIASAKLDACRMHAGFLVDYKQQSHCDRATLFPPKHTTDTHTHTHTQQRDE